MLALTVTIETDVFRIEEQNIIYNSFIRVYSLVCRGRLVRYRAYSRKLSMLFI